MAVGEDVSRVKRGDRVAATVFPRWLDGPFTRANAAQLGTVIDGVLTSELNRAVTAHRLRPVIDRVFPFGEVPDAFRHCESGRGFGKVIISHN